VRGIVEDAGFLAARGSDGGYNLKTANHYVLNRKPAMLSTSIFELKADVDKALSDKTWLILLFHEVNNSGDQYSISPETFQEFVNYLKEKNVVPVTMSEGINSMNQ
jgi:hypothetical protein